MHLDTKPYKDLGWYRSNITFKELLFYFEIISALQKVARIVKIILELCIQIHQFSSLPHFLYHSVSLSTHTHTHTHTRTHT